MIAAAGDKRRPAGQRRRTGRRVVNRAAGILNGKRAGSHGGEPPFQRLPIRRRTRKKITRAAPFPAAFIIEVKSELAIEIITNS